MRSNSTLCGGQGAGGKGERTRRAGEKDRHRWVCDRQRERKRYHLRDRGQLWSRLWSEAERDQKRVRGSGENGTRVCDKEFVAMLQGDTGSAASRDSEDSGERYTKSI
jgi:hypothetical protein